VVLCLVVLWECYHVSAKTTPVLRA
jgi:hypothetical protein